VIHIFNSKEEISEHITKFNNLGSNSIFAPAYTREFENGKELDEYLTMREEEIEKNMKKHKNNP